MSTIIMPSLNKKEQKLLESQITQTRHPKVLQTDGRSGPITRPAFSKVTQVTKQTDSPAMTIAVDLGRKATKPTNQQMQINK